MTTSLWGFALMSFLTLPTFASEFGSQRLSKADLNCEQQGNGIIIQLPKDAAPARIWQMDANKSEGLELDVTHFRIASCPGCFDFTAEVSGSEVRGHIVEHFIKYEMYDSKQETWTTLLDHVDCQVSPEKNKLRKL